MTEISERDLRDAMSAGDESSDAIARLLRDGKQHTDEFAGHLEIQARSWDILREWATQELARREAERDERAEPITAEWLKSIGFEKVTDNHDIFEHSEIAGVFILDSSGILSWRQEVYDLGEFITRGQLLDLLKALKGGE